jgi:hypothetical protein
MLESMTATILPADSSSVGSGAVVKKTVSFAENVVSDVYAVEKTDKALNGDLFYSSEDFRRFKQERRQTRIKSQRMACRSKSRRRGVMYETLMPTKSASSAIDYRVTSMNLIMEIDSETRLELIQAAF